MNTVNRQHSEKSANMVLDRIGSDCYYRHRLNGRTALAGWLPLGIEARAANQPLTSET